MRIAFYFFFLLALMACNATCEWQPVPQEQLTAESKQLLDSLFSNCMDDSHQPNTLYVIDDKAGLQLLHPAVGHIPGVDFNRHTLVVGCVQSSSISDSITSVVLLYCPQKQQYEYRVTIAQALEGFQAIGCFCNWMLVARKINEKEITLVVN